MKATQVLMQEHRLIEQVLDCLEDAASRLEDGGDIDPNFFFDAADFVQGFADGSHHRKEEDILFVALTEKDMPGDTGPVAVMLHEHEQGRQLTAGFRSAAEQMKEGDPGASMDVIRNTFDYVNLLREHILKEENVLFPMANQLLSDDAMTRISKEFEDIVGADEKTGETVRYQALAEKLSTYLSVETDRCVTA